MRNPLLTAKAVSSLDVLSGGRVTLGIGVGEPHSHELVGCDPRTRGRRCEEALVALKRLWMEDQVTLQGEFFRSRTLYAGTEASAIAPSSYLDGWA